MMDELIDRYGDLPDPALNLLTIALIRAEGVACGIQSIRQEGLVVFFVQEELDLDIWSELSDMTKGRLKMSLGKGTAIRLQLKAGENALNIIHKIFQKYLSLRHAEG